MHFQNILKKLFGHCLKYFQILNLDFERLLLHPVLTLTLQKVRVAPLYGKSDAKNLLAPVFTKSNSNDEC